MTNLLSAFKNKQTLVFIILVIISAVIIVVKLSVLLGLAILFILIITLFIPSSTADSYDDTVQQITKVITEAGVGKLEDRVTNIPIDSEYFAMAWGLNNLLDQVEAFMRDTISAIETSEFANVVLEDRFTGEQTDLLTDSNGQYIEFQAGK